RPTHFLTKWSAGELENVARSDPFEGNLSTSVTPRLCRHSRQLRPLRGCYPVFGAIDPDDTEHACRAILLGHGRADCQPTGDEDEIYKGTRKSEHFSISPLKELVV